MLLSVMVSIGEILDNIGISVMDIPHRPWVTFPHISSMERKLLSGIISHIYSDLVMSWNVNYCQVS